MDFGRLFVLKPAPIRFPRGIASALILPALLLLLPATLRAQATVTGTVTEIGGDPIVGAQVAVVGTDRGAVTDSDGRYVITGLPAGQSVTVRAIYLGRRDAVRDVTLSEGDNIVNLRMEPSPVELDAIVVTGVAGNVQRRAVGNAISDINADQVLEKAPVTNLAQLIEGRAAGTTVLQSSGTVGTGANLRLRGISSITQSNEPLIYIDGVRVDNNDEATSLDGFTVGGQGPSRLNDIVPEDIESIEIIKGPAAATLYGTEAAPGVIQIITKKGRAGETRWALRGSWGSVSLQNNDFPDNFAAVQTIPDCVPVEIGDISVSASSCGVRTIKTLEDGRTLIAQNPLEILSDDPGLTQDYTLSVSGGRDNFTFYTSGQFQREDGPITANFLDKVAARGNLQWTPSEIFEMSVSSGYINNEIRLPNNDNNIFGFWGNALLARPDRIRVNDAGDRFAFGEPFTPLENVQSLDSRFTNDRFTGSVTANFNPFPWLKNKGIVGIDLNAEENFQLVPFGAVASLNPEGERTNVRNTVSTITFDGNTTASFDLTETFRSNSSAGLQIFNENIDEVIAFGEDFPAPGVSTVSAAGATQGFEARQEDTTVGVYLQEQLAYANRFFLTGAVRFDDNSAFGSDFDFETYPKVSVSYVVSEEPWWAWDFINTLKIRSAYGFAGQQPQTFASLRTFDPVSIRGGTPTITPDEVGNPELGPERSREVEVGFDSGLWDDRVGFELTYYDKVTEDAIVDRPNIPSEGFPGSQFFNIGEVQNSGWEFGLNGLLLDTTPVDYEFFLTYSTNENEVTDLGGVAPFATPGGFEQRVAEGFPVDAYWGTLIVGHDGTTPIFSDTAHFVGRATPGNFGAWGSTVTLWDHLQLYGLLEWKRDFFVHNNTEFFRFAFASARERWDPDLMDDQVVIDKIAAVGEDSPTPFIYEGDFVVLREVSASYTLPDTWAQAMRSRRAAITLSARNLKKWTDYPGVDPETNVFGQTDLVRSDFLTVPQSRRVIATLNLTF